MNWGEIKGYLEAEGVTDSTEVYYKDMNFGGKEDPLDTLDIQVVESGKEILLDSRHYDYID